jgi:hypothetical protein
MVTILYHEGNKVLEADLNKETISVFNPVLLPFSLREREPTFAMFQEWRHNRVKIMSRTFMPKIYSYRGIGRSEVRLVLDSSAVTVIDNFWLWRTGMKRTWQDILSLRDTDDSLFCVALDGKENPAVRLKKFEDIASILTIKGAFPKAVHRDKILKKGFNAHFEIAAAEIGNALGIAVAQARESSLYDGAVESDVFTNVNLSMAHAGDVIDLNTGSEPRELFYVKLIEWGRQDMVKQFQRILILSYVTSNFDMHHENFGFLYDPKTFNVISMAPAFDFNDAFQNWGSPAIFHEWELNHMSEWIHNNKDILANADAAAGVVKQSKYLDDEQKAGVIDRINYLLAL